MIEGGLRKGGHPILPWGRSGPCERIKGFLVSCAYSSRHLGPSGRARIRLRRTFIAPQCAAIPAKQHMPIAARAAIRLGGDVKL